jgi:type II secretory pathway pseudopilin PulG
MRRKGEKGFTLIEVTIILLVLVILGAILLPMAELFIDLAGLARVREDIGALAAVIELFKVDTCNTFFKVDGDGPNTAANRLDLMVGDGDTPPVNNASDFKNYWLEAVDSPTAAGQLFVDTIANHLALGDPYGGAAGDPYPRPSASDPNPFRCGWRGAYIQTPIQADPWGNRYMINVAFLGPASPGPNDSRTGIGDFGYKDTFVLSAGPDEEVHTGFAVDGVVAAGDDQIAVVSGGRM